MLCFQCGSPVSAEDIKCPNCGASLQKGGQRRKSRVATSDNLQRFTQQMKAVVVEEQALFAPGVKLDDGRFHVESLLGKGPFGQTFIASDKKEGGAKVVIKALRPAIFAGADELDRFRLTLKKARRLEQRNLIKIYGGGVHELTPWLALEFVEGLSLRDVLKLRATKKERFSVAEVEALVSPMITALQRVHREFPHGNLRPENLYYSPERLKIADYYLMAMLPPGAWVEPLGASQYLPPELRSGKADLSPSADIFAIGALVSEMLFGQVPAPSKVDPEHEAIAEICRSAMHEDARKRPASLEALGEELATVFDAQTLMERSEPSLAPPPAPVGPPAPPSAPMAPPSAPLAPPTAPAGVEAAPKPEATQILNDAEVEVIGALSTKGVTNPGVKPAQKTEAKKEEVAQPAKKGKRANRRPMPKDEEVAATAISGSGESKSNPKPIPETPASKEKKPAPKAPPAPPAAAEDELETVDLRRGVMELGDLLPTNDLERGRIPPPREPKLERETTKTTVGPVGPPTGREEKKSGIPPWAIILGVATVVVVVALIASNSKPKKVTIDDTAQATKPAEVKPSESTPPASDVAQKPADMGAPAQAQPDAAKDASLKEAATKLAAAQETSSSAAEVAAKAAAPAEQPKDETPPAVATAPVKDNGAKPDGAKVEPKVDKDPKTAQGSKVEPKTDAKPAEVAKGGTKCAGGMILLKSSSGAGVCVDAREFPGSGKPKTGVSWFQAKKLCEGRGKRLCGLQEWRQACGGSRYPYGSKWDPDRCNTQDEDEFDRSLAATGSFSKCKSRSGAYDMVGNVHEWVEEKMIAGGGYDSGPTVASCSYASPSSPSSQAKYIGFRCCADPQ